MSQAVYRVSSLLVQSKVFDVHWFKGQPILKMKIERRDGNSKCESDNWKHCGDDALHKFNWIIMLL